MMEKIKFRAFILCLFMITQAYTFDKYLLCGSDEDGCYDYRSCACIPYETSEIGKPFCLNWEKLICEPYSEIVGCHAYFTHTNKAKCLAALFQSTASNPCKEVPENFCLEHKIVICAKNGDFDSCKRS